jgi:hypothetical protein
VDGRGSGLAAGIETPLLLFPRCGAIVGGAALVRTLPAVVLLAAERTTQDLAVNVPRIREKGNAAVRAKNDATLQFRMELEGRVQRDQVLPD